MSETKWTLGKWRVISSGRHVVSDDAPGHVLIVRTGLDHSEGDEMPDTIERWEADAHLIAAAPELYEALENTNRELNSVIEKINDMLKSKISSSDLQPPDYWDQQTVCENAMLLAKARGES